MPTGTITDYQHPAYCANVAKWTKVRDACAGEDAVKDKRCTYLPNPDETSGNGNDARYRTYLRRAVYLNATGRTLQGLIGMAYGKWPTIETQHKRLLEDVDGSGITLINQSQRVLSGVLQTGRAGLLADWPKGDGISRKRTLAQAEAAGTRPLIAAYSAESILTWEREGTSLTRVVLQECAEIHGGGEVSFRPQLRELLLIDGRYIVKLWTKFSDNGQFILTDTIAPTPALSYIPFAFIGATNNDPEPDTAPLLDLANLNLAHYRNSADFEESAFLMGQPQLVVTGATEEWKLATGAIAFGARGGLCAPPGGDMKLLQVAPNTLAKEAMLDKERMMAMLGARLLAPTEAAKTATQSASETRSAYSTLSLACDNVSAGYTRVLQWLETWGTTRAPSASFALDTQFNEVMLDANAIRETVAAWQAGLVPHSDAIAVLQRLNVIDQGKTPEQVQAEVEAQGPALDLGEVA